MERDTIFRVAGPQELAGDRGPRLVISEAVSESYSSASALAQAFGSVVLEPSWWPADVRKIAYYLDRFPRRDSYRVGSTRRDGVPICVVGRFEVARSGRASGEWYEPRELAAVRGQIGRVGIPARLQAVVHDEKLAIDLIGYETEDEILSAVRSLRRVRPDEVGHA